MTDIERLLDQYDRVMHGNAWHGDAIWQILDGISAECAAARPVADTHSIWEILMHMTFWEGVSSQRLAGERAGLVEDEALNFPATPEPTEANWQKTREEFRASNQKLREALAKLDPAAAGCAIGCRKKDVLRRSPRSDPAQRLSRRANSAFEERF